MNKFLKIAIGLLMLFNCYTSTAQKKGIEVLDSLLNIEANVLALKSLESFKSELIAKNDIDSLVDYIYYEGRIKSKLEGKEIAIQGAEGLAKLIREQITDGQTQKRILINLGTFYDFIGDVNKALGCNVEALSLARRLPNESASELASLETNVGTFYRRLGDLESAIAHIRRSSNLYYSDENSSHEAKYKVNNSLGGLMWFSSKLDSAQYYYDLAYEEVIQSDSSAKNLFFRPAILKNNLSAIYGINGNSKASIDAMNSAIDLMGNYLEQDIPDSERRNAEEFYFQLMDNLGGAYKKLGDYSKAKKLISYAYEQKKSKFSDESPEIFKGEILMGQIELSLLNYQEAENHLLEGIRRLNLLESGFTFWRADAHHYLGSLYEQILKDDLAEENYILAEKYFEQALQGSFDEIYLSFVIYAAPFYARRGNEEKALELANKALEYLESSSGSESILAYAQRINVGEVHYILGNYNEAFKNSEEALASLNSTEGLVSKMDSINIDFKKPLAIFLREKSRLKLQDSPSKEDLQKTYASLNSMVEILERRKSNLVDEEAVSVLVADYDDSFEFLKDVSAQLYYKTSENKYLDKIINLNESSLYNKIRSQLSEQTTFSGVPSSILTKEKELKEALLNWEEKDSGIDSFLEAEKNWNEFLQSLVQNYPDYFNLKYESLNFPLDDIQKRIPHGTTIVRYIYINDDVYALILDDELKMFIPLNQSRVSENIQKLADENIGLKENSLVLHELYKSLWKPLEKFVNHQNIVIIPERELFNLSFESLITEPINSYEELASKSLLAKYFICYNYSLFLISENQELNNDLESLVAFAPGFDDAMKEEYKNTLQDSLSFDFSYLNLLPQPFALELANESAKLFNGNAYVKNNSTASAFSKYAGGQNIIYIGTHAESNNVSPQLSKFIFAKEQGSESNELFSHELYNLDLESNLTILTACETGKPSHQPGEGMISMAHAFNYSGSKSIVTSLWKIDEKASVKIVNYFYENLKDGLSKSEALQKAKIKYLNTEDGRTLEPRYWAGLVLLGDNQPLEFNSSFNVKVPLSIIGLVLLMLLTYRFKRKTIN